MRHIGTVFPAFHASLDFKRINARFNQFRYIKQSADVFCIQIVFPALISLKGQPARLGAHATVPAAAPDHFTHKALSGVTITQSTMYKYLHLQICLFPGLFNFLN